MCAYKPPEESLEWTMIDRSSNHGYSPNMTAMIERLELVQAKISSVGSAYGYFPLAAVTILAYALIRGIYLLYLHPLSKVPGPKWAAISNIPYGIAWMSGRYPWAMEKLFKQYGNVVRCAPNEVCFISPEAYAQIYTSTERGRPTFLKSDLLDDPSKYPGLFSVKDVDEHKAARRIFQPAFNSRLFPEYAPVIDKYVKLWFGKLEKISGTGKGVDMTHWMEYLMADIGGIMTFGHEFKNVESEHGGPLLESIDSLGWWGTARVTLKRFPFISWVQWLLIWPPALMTYTKSINTNIEAVAERIKDPDHKQKDYLTPLLTEGGSLPPTAYLASHLTNILYGHVETATIATAAVYFLCMHPEVHNKLQKEMRDKFQSLDQLTDEALQSISWLWPCINEAIRLQTNVPYGLPRVSPGVEIDGYYIPKGAVVSSAAFATTHSPQYFQKAREYRPERWLPRTHPDYNKVFDDDNRDAFRPFSMGSRGCIGQAFAGMMLRCIIGRLCWKYDWEMLNKGEVYWERDIRLFTVWSKPPIVVRYNPIPSTIT